MLRAFHFFAFHFCDRVLKPYETALTMEHGELLLQAFYEGDVAHVPFFPRLIFASALQGKHETALAMEHGELLGRTSTNAA